jgi:putative two-component system response regulator
MLMTEDLKLLLIEDNYDDELIILRALKQAGYTLTHQRVETEAALQVALMTRDWDIVICDYRMPRLNVYRAMELLKASGQDMPLIVFSGAVQEDAAIELLKAGASDFVTKDRMPRLVLAIRRELRQQNERARHRLDLELAYEQTMLAWGKALELRDHHTQGHTLRVTDLALRLARIYEFSGQAFKDMYRGALLHDVGKMGVPDMILTKRDAFTLEERKVMEMHPVLAYEMLAPIEFLQGALDIPYCHHEKWNGKGYPRGLMGTDIPLPARIFSVVDVYDALTSDRPYRASWPKEKAIDHLVEEKNKSFDPQAVDRFVEIVKA